MKEFRMDKNTKEHYTSLDEMRNAWGIKPLKKQTSDLKKLDEQRTKFKARHCCKACGEPMKFTPNNMMVCKNSSCKGIKIEFLDKEGNKVVRYEASYELLDSHSAEIANNIFA